MGWLFKIMMGRRYRKARSFERFIELLLWEGCQSVYVTIEMRSDWPAMPEIDLIGQIGNFTHSIRFVGTNTRGSGKRVLYEEACQKWFGASTSPTDIDVRAMAAFETLVEAERKLKIFENPLFSSTYVQLTASNQAIADIERYLRIYGNKADLRLVVLYHYLKRKYPYTL